MPISHGISREHDAMHVTQIFIGWSGIHHAHVECVPCMGHIRQKKYPFYIDCKIFS